MKRILLVGNGFDLAHGLMTKYEQFLFLMKNWDEFYHRFVEEIEKQKAELKSSQKENELLPLDIFAEFVILSEPENEIDKYVNNVLKVDQENIRKLGEIIKNNSWARYFCQCEAEIDQWIDFEKEIYPVIDLFEYMFNANYTHKVSSSLGNICIL